jgi:hypothetical protein
MLACAHYEKRQAANGHHNSEENVISNRNEHFEMKFRMQSLGLHGTLRFSVSES